MSPLTSRESDAVKALYNSHAYTMPEEVLLHLETSASGVVFKRQAGAVFIDPACLEAIREVSDRGTAVVVEEARWHNALPSDRRPDDDQCAAQPSEASSSYQRVVVKSYRPTFISTNAELQLVIEEAKRIHALKHNNVIGLLGLGCYNSSGQDEIRGSLFYVEEFAGSWSLFKMLRSKWLHPTHPHVQFTPADCMRWCVNVADGLAYLHLHHIVHRDLKAENIFLSDSDISETFAKIGDIKPHRRNFRKYAQGHLRTTRSTDLDAPTAAGPDISQRGRMAMSQFSLSRHNSMAIRQLRMQRSTGREERDEPVELPAPHPSTPQGAAGDNVRSLKKRELSSSFRLRHNNEALPLIVCKDHPHLDALGAHSFIKAVEKKMGEEMDVELLKAHPSIDNCIKRQVSKARGSNDAAGEGGGGSGLAPQLSASSPRSNSNRGSAPNSNSNMAASPFSPAAQLAWPRSPDGGSPLPAAALGAAKDSAGNEPGLGSGSGSGSGLPPVAVPAPAPGPGMSRLSVGSTTNTASPAAAAAAAAENVGGFKDWAGAAHQAAGARSSAPEGVKAARPAMQVRIQDPAGDEAAAPAPVPAPPVFATTSHAESSGGGAAGSVIGAAVAATVAAAAADGGAAEAEAAAETAAEAAADELATHLSPEEHLVRQRTMKAVMAAGAVGSRSVRKREGKLRVTFREGIPEGLPATEDYSLVYAPPEYICNMSCDTLKALGPKADVFSFAKIMYEVLTQRLINPAALLGAAEGWHMTSDVLQQYSDRVTAGYREPIPDNWPATVRALIEQCWSQDPKERPSMAFVASRLRELAADPEVLADLEPPPPPPESSKSDEELDYGNCSSEEDEDEGEDGDAEAGHAAGSGRVDLARNSAGGGPFRRISMLGQNLARTSAGGGISRTSMGSKPNVARVSRKAAAEAEAAKAKSGCSCVIA